MDSYRLRTSSTRGRPSSCSPTQTPAVGLMTSSISHDLFEHLDTGTADNTGYGVLPTIPAPQLPDDMESTEVFDVAISRDDSISNLVDHLTYRAEADMFAPFMDELQPLFAYGYDDRESGALGRNTTVPTRKSPTSNDAEVHWPTQSADVQRVLGGMPKDTRLPLTGRKRKQYHSCDPCRSSKRGCDLPMDIDIRDKRPVSRCSTCRTRDLECTVVWLASRPQPQPVTKQARTDTIGNGGLRKKKEHLPDTPVQDELAPVSASELELVRQVTACEAYSQQFSLYVDIWDVPMTNCISHPCIPRCYRTGVTGLGDLSKSAAFGKYFDQAQLWINSSWPMNSASWDPTSSAPHLFFAACILDALFQQPDGQPYQTSMESHDLSISETYRWVALATAAQFAVAKNGHDDPSPRRRDMAETAWHKARQLVFENIAATSSFRLALSLLLFGIILVPTPVTQRSMEDATYANCEGIRRLQKLCAHAGAFFPENRQSRIPSSRMGRRRATEKSHPIQSLPSPVRARVLELIGALEWLANISNWTGIITSRGQTYASVPRFHDDNATNVSSTTGATQQAVAGDPVEPAGHESGLYDMVVTRARKEAQPVTAVWSRGVEEDNVLRAVHRSASVVILLFKSLALLNLAVHDFHDNEADYEEIYRHCVTMSTVVDLWRMTFGKFNETTRSGLQQSGPRLRRPALFCSVDGDFAVLQFYEIVSQLQSELELQPSGSGKERLCVALQSMSASCNEHRLLSAMQISFLHSTVQGISSPGFQGTSSLKAYIQDLAAHPRPYLVVEALSLAAKALSEEVHSCVIQMDTKRASEMTAHLDTCLNGLQGFKETLVMFPDVSRKGPWGRNKGD